MTFMEGRFFVIQGMTREGQRVFCEAKGRDTTALALKKIRKSGSYGGSYGSYSHTYDEDRDEEPSMVHSTNPFEVKVWATDGKFKLIVDQMRSIRKVAGSHGVDPFSLKIVLFETSIQAYVPEAPSDEETELRRYALEKLSVEEKKLLDVVRWEVYGKLADRRNLEDDDAEG